MKGYKTSKDYKRLKELLDKGYEVVCFITYDFLWRSQEPHEPMMVTDICRAKFIKREQNRENDVYVIGVRGLSYITFWPNSNIYDFTFEDRCKAENIEFIEPTEEEKK